MPLSRLSFAPALASRPTPGSSGRWLTAAFAGAAGTVALVAAGATLGGLAVAAIAAAGLMLLRPPVALGLLAASIPLQDVVAHNVGGFALRPTSAILLGLTGAWLLRLVVERRPPRLTWPVLPYAVFVALLLASGFVARDGGEWLRECYRWGASLLVFLVALDTIASPAATRPLLVGMAGGVALAAILGVVQTVAAIGPPSYRVGGFTRAYATFGAPNPFAGFLELIVPLLFAVAGAWLHQRRLGQTGETAERATPGWLAALCATAAALGAVALILTQSRGGWLGGIAALGLVAYLTGGPRWATLTLAGFVLLALLTPPVGGRLATLVANAIGIAHGEDRVTDENFAAQERVAHWRTAAAMARDRPLLGVGAGNFSARFADYAADPDFPLSRGHAHSNYLQAAAQSGLLGLGAYLALLAAVALQLGRALRNGDDWARPLVVGAIGVTVALAIHGVFEYLHVLSLGLQLSLVWALAEASTRRPQLATVTA